ncbi:hypothetical protein BDB01DRAFT_813462 [Pilobolus umbonatus]|nr:hypothetical protein BDB01DRAFT_813462 [Pilobolus umbonatus]
MSCNTPITSPSTISRSSELLCQLQNEQHSVILETDMEEGPIFDSIVSQLEDRTTTMKGYLKQILKASVAVQEAKQLVIEAESSMMDILREIPLCKPLFNHYLDGIQKTIEEENNRLIYSMQSMLVDPLQKLYQADIKPSDTKKREFDEIRREYITQLKKYLAQKSSGKNKVVRDRKFRDHQSKFELARFDYYNYLRDLHGGKKDQEILYHLLSLFEKQHCHVQSVSKLLNSQKHGLEELAALMAGASYEQRKTIMEKIRKRNSIKNPPMGVENDIATHEFVLDTPVVGPFEFIEIDMPVKQQVDKFKGIRDLQQIDNTCEYIQNRRKQGYLLVSQKNHGSSWTRSWCVVSNGLLYEFPNLKNMKGSSQDPIDLKYSCVRLARNVDRQYCFEVVAASKSTRYYQTTSDEEANEWIQTINNSIAGVLKGTGSAVNFREIVSPEENDSFSRMIRNFASDNKTKSRRSQARPVRRAAKEPIQPVDKNFTLKQNLMGKFKRNSSNQVCADCDAPNPEWCSINLGIIVCIECSGIHRSLGSDISKIRSVELDIQAFTVEILHIMLSTGNKVFNEIWEANLGDVVKPIWTDSRETKSSYIKAKYVTKDFVSHTADSTAIEILLNAVHSNNIPQALHAIGLNVNINYSSPSNNGRKDHNRCALHSALLNGQSLYTDSDDLIEVSRKSPSTVVSPTNSSDKNSVLSPALSKYTSSHEDIGKKSNSPTSTDKPIGKAHVTSKINDIITKLYTSTPPNKVNTYKKVSSIKRTSTRSNTISSRCKPDQKIASTIAQLFGEPIESISTEEKNILCETDSKPAEPKPTSSNSTEPEIAEITSPASDMDFRRCLSDIPSFMRQSPKKYYKLIRQSSRSSSLKSASKGHFYIDDNEKPAIPDIPQLPIRIYPIAELLIQNGADVHCLDPGTGRPLWEMIHEDACIEKDALLFIQKRLALRGEVTGKIEL